MSNEFLKDTRALYLLGQQPHHNLVINAGKKLGHIAFEHISVTVHELTRALPGRRGSLPYLAGKAAGNESFQTILAYLCSSTRPHSRCRTPRLDP